MSGLLLDLEWHVMGNLVSSRLNAGVDIELLEPPMAPDQHCTGVSEILRLQMETRLQHAD